MPAVRRDDHDPDRCTGPGRQRERDPVPLGPDLDRGSVGDPDQCSCRRLVLDVHGETVRDAARAVREGVLKGQDTRRRRQGDRDAPDRCPTIEVVLPGRCSDRQPRDPRRPARGRHIRLHRRA